MHLQQQLPREALEEKAHNNTVPFHDAATCQLFTRIIVSLDDCSGIEVAKGAESWYGILKY